MAARISHSVGVWHLSNGISAMTIDIQTNDPAEASLKFNELVALLKPAGYGLSLRQRTDNERELERTR